MLAFDIKSARSTLFVLNICCPGGVDNKLFCWLLTENCFFKIKLFFLGTIVPLSLQSFLKKAIAPIAPIPPESTLHVRKTTIFGKFYQKF